MGAALLVCRIVLAVVLMLAGASKLADLAGSRRALIDFGLPEAFAGPAGVLLPAAELTAGVALIPLFSARFGAIGAGVLLVAFCAAIANAVAHGRAPDCHCFGQVHSAPASWRTLARNLVLVGLAGFVAIAGWHSAGVSATRWVARLPAPWLVAIAAAIVILGLIGFQVWFSLQLLSQNGRTLGRLEALETTLAAIATGAGLPAVPRGPLGEGLRGGGLPVGSEAPAFELEGVDGELYALETLLGDGREQMLVFTSAGCGPCDAVMPDLSRWQREHAQRLTISLVATGDAGENRAKAGKHRLVRVLLDSERQVSNAYEANGTPMALIVDPDGRIISPTVGGPEAITTLVAQATRPALAVQHLAAGNGANGNGAQLAPAPDTSQVGEPAPELVLSNLDAQQVALRDLYTERTVALFWNPGCGFCQRMLDDLRAFEDDRPASAPELVVISSGDPEHVREQGIRSPLVLDRDGEAMNAFGAGGTPMGVLIEDGKIASHVAAGADAVFELLGTS
jgi:peroxiredoxin/uncharacterized membrane protein YphA (DoxX/SURF4 family)